VEAKSIATKSLSCFAKGYTDLFAIAKKKNRLVRELDDRADPITLRGGLIYFFTFFYKEREILFSTKILWRPIQHGGVVKKYDARVFCTLFFLVVVRTTEEVNEH